MFYSRHFFLSFPLLPKNLKIKTFFKVLIPVFFCLERGALFHVTDDFTLSHSTIYFLILDIKNGEQKNYRIT